MNNLGNLARQRRDYTAAIALYEQSLGAGESFGRRSYRVLSNLGRTLLLLGRPDEARPHLERSWEIKRRDAPETLDVAASLMLLGDLERMDGRVEAARSEYADALALHGRLVPGRPAEAENQIRLALLELEAGKVERAEALLRKAVTTLESHPETSLASEAFYHLGRVRTARGDREAASDLYRRAVEALDGQWRVLGGSRDARLSWMHSYAETYRAYIELLVDLGRRREAFEVLERYRARLFRERLGQRDLDLPSTARAAEIERELNELSRARERLLEAPTRDGDSLDALTQLAGERTRLLAELRLEAPRLARVRYPSAITVAGAADALDPGEILLSFVTSHHRTLVFALSGKGPRSVQVASVDITQDELAKEVQDLRHLIERRNLADLDAIDRRAERLYDLLLRPLDDVIASATRLTFVPDGPLHRLPFSVLRRDGRYLVEERPLRLAASATLLAWGSEPSGRGSGAVAFGDPELGAPSSPKASADDGGLRPLPASRVEVEALRRVLPSPVEILVGDAATEQRAKALADERFIHFAGHALVDETLPLSSALALASGPRGTENGRLYAWEILEQVRLEASLVTLSACETALGPEHAGEGALGFVWAFRQAGARSVLASLWKIEDRSTSSLMGDFYGALVAGVTKDEALRRSQLEQIGRTAEASGVGREAEDSVAYRGVGGLVDAAPGGRHHPFYWASFQLYGSVED